MILRYTPRARQDLHEIKDYVKNELANPQAAARIVERILKGCSNLKSNPYLGLDLSSKIGQKTDLRYLILSNYIAYIEKKIIRSVLSVSWMAGQIICVICCQRYDFITICEQSKFATHKQRKAVFCCAEIADDGLRAFAIKKRTLHLTLLVECSVLYFIEKKFRFMIGVN